MNYGMIVSLQIAMAFTVGALVLTNSETMASNLFFSSVLISWAFDNVVDIIVLAFFYGIKVLSKKMKKKEDSLVYLTALMMRGFYFSTTEFAAAEMKIQTFRKQIDDKNQLN